MKSNKIKNWFRRTFSGIYGIDNLYFVLFGAVFLLMIINAFVNSWVFWIPEALIMAFMVFRALSHNIAARKRENDAFFGLFKRLKSFIKLQKARFKDRKTHIYRKCPVCHAVLRLPKKDKKEKKEVVCPRCGRRFKV